MNQRNAVRVLVLCAGNIGRSPLAEVLLKHSVAEALGIPETDLAEAGVAIRSAGTEAPQARKLRRGTLRRFAVSRLPPSWGSTSATIRQHC